MIELTLVINGRKETVSAEPTETLLDVLRNRLHLNGTKDGCREGECGACTVLIDGKPVDSCLYAAKAAEGRAIETIEGLNSENDKRLQTLLVEGGGVQCGYCTPGFVMMATALLRDHPAPSESLVREALNGNLCRCTGYTQIVNSIMAAAHGADEVAV